MKNIAIIGASGYTGAQITSLIHADAGLSVQGLYVSENSLDKGRELSELYPLYSHLPYVLNPLSDDVKAKIVAESDAVVLATEHSVSLELAAWFYQQGLAVFDLSGAYRFADVAQYPKWYGFEHTHPDVLAEAVYGLAEWNAAEIAKTRMIAVPGCYPTASLTALKPLKSLLTSAYPVINAVSGVTGAGRKAHLHTSFCEVSLTPYGVLGHRHQPEIATQLGQEVIFTPHLGNFKRGILATITVQLQPGTTEEQVKQAYEVYDNSPLVTVKHNAFPKVDDVVHTPNCHLGWKYDANSGYLVVASAIDNLMKGAASQGLQCIKIHFNL
ncbi:N-acetyl-gamma-glutamyl-phosphate reductase [Shewanella denitrificans OS217]|jgi:N-acetyl-gamma-glutamyl-phosphate reductase|uniref:N-acetyl-gamma-glutamyl-phosphate reductase n=1 Tax=Shewanella denitrificans (strain OS217 / ATCC BAA-1090 / DSM 15013) TaxID=318161 RepID=ARGC_SHEDO|nr:N-acetyl-gamma-glutamyl-phosphate reductase [Shewanella denitrificans]Q12SN0.1 RecName: Full=N-acetyl-gamma-glutamyl-phosphate reductase; Short=AGPR; AltName: Full=N-acetyl-glutamate semialdehyde dehydrogenase; Short=NAGSA dehydrogenase [Shewanella denitrificans OS217]ABE53546.1 N-acetyl-gamma-glutamyl-phosphate reductase [Shewanella denitrificans OS217]